MRAMQKQHIPSPIIVADPLVIDEQVVPSAVSDGGGLMTRKRRTYEGAEFIPLSKLARLLGIGEKRAETFVRRGLLPAPCQVGTVPRWHWPSVRALILGKGDPAAPTSEAGEDDIKAAITARLKKATANAA